ncbi:MAG: hypothetical protein AAFO01_14005 [Pseudomonadota bacterium]
MRFTERDGRLLHWINGHGFVTLRQVARWLGTNYQTAQRRVRLLYDGGYIDCQWLVHGDRAHWLTPAGRAMCGDSLPPPKHIRLGSYRHDRMLVDLALTLTADNGGHFTPERRLRQVQELDRVGKRGHVADGWLHTEDQKKPIAIELELSTKGSRRLERILRGYMADLDIAKVWYFVECEAVRRQLAKAAKDLGFIKIHDLPSSCCQLVGNQVSNHEGTPASRSDAEPLCRKEGCGQGRRQPPEGEVLTASDRRLTGHPRIVGHLLDEGRSS